MSLTKPNQDLFEDFEGCGACLDWTAGDLKDIAKRIEDAGMLREAKALMEISKDLREWREILFTFSDEVQKGSIIRGNV